jgi:N-acetylmuramoyl-L-alanine amidase
MGGSLMAAQYEVQQGDCLSSIACEYGFLPDALWNHPDNADLKQKRKDPNVLAKGDVITIPDIEIREVSKPTEQKHEFRRKGVPAKLKIQILKKGQPRKNEEYRLIIDGITLEGTTDGNGFIDKPLPPNAQSGKLIVGEGTGQQVFALNFGHVDPLDTDDGVAGRLHNLGYSAAGDLPSALKKFQSDNGLQPTGKADDATRNKLKEKFGQ